MPSSSRTAQCGTAEARSRLRTARAYLEVAVLVLDERDRDRHGIPRSEVVSQMGGTL
jgi:hypothetical protein